MSPRGPPPETGPRDRAGVRDGAAGPAADPVGPGAGVHATVSASGDSGTAPSPTVHGTAFVASSADILGDVTLEEDASVWYGCVLRGDVAPIRVGARTNLQDLSLVHADAGFPTLIGSDVGVGHGAILHGCEIGEGCLIGMGAIVLSGAVIGAGSVVAAGALVTEGARVPPGRLIVGVPGRVVRGVDEELRGRARRTVEHYLALKEAHRGGRWRPPS